MGQSSNLIDTPQPVQALVDFEKHKKAGELLNLAFSGASLICIGGGIRGGKTFGCLGVGILYAKLYPGSRGVIIRDSTQTLRRNTLPSCRKAFPEAFIKNYRDMPPSWTFTNGSEIFFMGENIDKDPELDRFNGLEVNWILLEQIEEIQLKTFEKSLERAGSYFLPDPASGYPPPLIMATVNPTDVPWVRQKIYEPAMDGNLPKGWHYIQARVDDNPFAPPGYLESLAALKVINPVKYKKFVEGDWSAREKTGSEFYRSFSVSDHVAPVTYDPAQPLHLSFDFNVSPYMTCIICQIQGEDVQVINEICLAPPRATTQATCSEFLARYNKHQGGVFIYGDPSGGKKDTRSTSDDYQIIMMELKQYRPTLRVGRAAQPVASRGMWINAIFAGLEPISLIIGEDALKLQGDLMGVLQDADGGKIKKRKKDRSTGITAEQFGHTSDALDYFLTEAFLDYYTRFLSGPYIAPIIGPSKRLRF